MNPLISVIVPVYKVEKYIDECIQSIVNQTYSNWELLLVDDGSPDRCGEICDRYAEKDQRIIVIHKRNGGLSDARNVAIDAAKGQFITFIDSDDYVDVHYLEDMICLMTEKGADIAQCECTRDSATLGERTSQDKYSILKDSDIIRSFLRFGTPCVLACGKVYRASLFDTIRFPVGRIDEDNFTTYKTFLESKLFINLNRELYYYRRNMESITHRRFGPEKFGILDCVPAIREDVGRLGIPVEDDIDYYEMRELLQIYNNAIASRADRTYCGELKRIKQRISVLTKSIRTMECRYRLMTFCLLHVEPLYKQIIRLLRKES